MGRKVILGFNKLTNSRFQFGNAAEEPPMQCPSFQLCEPASHGVQPRSTGWREVQLETQVVLEPLLDGRRFVSRPIFQDDGNRSTNSAFKAAM